MFLAMRPLVATGALGHDLVEIIFPGIVGVKHLVAELAIEAVLAALVFEILIMRYVASGAISYSQRFR